MNPYVGERETSGGAEELKVDEVKNLGLTIQGNKQNTREVKRGARWRRVSGGICDRTEPREGQGRFPMFEPKMSRSLL